jgi:hypothetical protein
MDRDKINLANRIIKAQDELIDTFDEWVRFIKKNDLAEAHYKVVLSNALRIKVRDMKKEYEKLNKKSGIILLNSKLN